MTLSVFVMLLTQSAAAGPSPTVARTGPVQAVASTPREAVESLAERLVAPGLPLEVGATAFDGLPAPAAGIEFVASAEGVEAAAFRLSVTVEARTARNVLARRSYVFPWRVREHVVVPNRALRPGDVITSDDLHVVEMAIDASAERYALSLDGLVGRVARGTLLPDRPIPIRLVERPAVVLRGAPVMVQVRTGPMRVTMEGEALEDGAVGETVKVLNTSSKRALSGRVVEAGLVEISR